MIQKFKAGQAVTSNKTCSTLKEGTPLVISLEYKGAVVVPCVDSDGVTWMLNLAEINAVKVLPGATVYTLGSYTFEDGTKLKVSDTHNGGEMVSCLDELNKVFFIHVTNLSLKAPEAKLKEYKFGQILYTTGDDVLPNGKRVSVATAYKGYGLVHCLDSVGEYHYTPYTALTKTAPKLEVITQDTVKDIEKALEAIKPQVPNWLTPLGSAYVASGRYVYVFGLKDVPDQTCLCVADTHIFKFADKTIRCVSKVKAPWEFFDIPKENLYIHVNTTHNSAPVVKKPLALDFKQFTEDHKYMIELLKEPQRAKVIALTMRGVDLTQYDIIAGLKHYVIVPKKPETAFMPMIMAHTDIQANVKHPDDNLEYDPKLDRFSSPRGLGADDRAGCYAINRILLANPGKFIVALFDEEEIGCNGSKEFAASKQFADVDAMASCYVSIDRKRGYGGVSQIATYDSDNAELFDLIKLTTGRATVRGSSTDCKALASGSAKLPKQSGLACFNMSCGYENEHQSSEALYFKELEEVVVDFDCMVMGAPELWTKRFSVDKKATVYPKYSGYQNTAFVESVEVDGEEYEEADVKTLLYLYHQFTGKAYEFNKATLLCRDYSQNEYVRLDPACAVGGVYGGVKLTKDLVDVLGSHTWIVDKIKNMRHDMTSEDGKSTATGIPAAWLLPVLVGDPLVQTK